MPLNFTREIIWNLECDAKLKVDTTPKTRERHLQTLIQKIYRELNLSEGADGPAEMTTELIHTAQGDRLRKNDKQTRGLIFIVESMAEKRKGDC